MTRSSSGILLYDGDCGFCSRWVLWARTHLPAEVAIESSTSADLEELGVSVAEARAAAWWIEPDGRRRRGHAAIARTLVECRGMWRVFGHVLVLPPVSWCAAGVYALVARYRSHLPGGSPSCRLHRP
jgi:predicted DCC family thiol-disulfide oxidoreductase YuxK